MSEMTNNDALLQLQELIARAANIVSRDWPGVLDADDVSQGINLRLIRDKYALAVMELPDDAARLRMLIKIGGQIAKIERADYERFSGRYHYSTDEVRRCLEYGALEGNPQFFNVQTTDILEAFEELKADYRGVLNERFVDRVVAPDRKKVTRAIDALTAIVNKKTAEKVAAHEGPGERKVLTNSAAVAALSNNS